MNALSNDEVELLQRLAGLALQGAVAFDGLSLAEDPNSQAYTAQRCWDLAEAMILEARRRYTDPHRSQQKGARQ